MPAPTSPTLNEMIGRDDNGLLALAIEQCRRVEDAYDTALPEWNIVEWIWSDPQPTLAHGDWLRINEVSGFDAFPSVVLPDALPIGSKVVVSDYQGGGAPQSGHTGGMNFNSAHTITDPETLYDAAYSALSWSKWFSGGAPAAYENAVMFTRTVTGWKIQCRPLGQAWNPYAVDNTAFTPGVAWVNQHGHCPRDEGNYGAPLGWKPRVGNIYAPFYSIQEAYDNGATTIRVAKQIGGGSPWSPGGLKMRGDSSEVITLIGEESGVEVGLIECAAHGANATLAPDGPSEDPLWYWNNEDKDPEIRIIGHTNIIFSGFESIAATPGATGVQGSPGESGGLGYSATIRLTNCIGAPGTTATAQGASGGAGGTGSPGETSSDSGYDGGPGGNGGNAYVYLTNCTNITAVKNPGAGGPGGAGGAAGGDEGTTDGATGATGAAGTTN